MIWVIYFKRVIYEYVRRIMNYIDNSKHKKELNLCIVCT